MKVNRGGQTKRLADLYEDDHGQRPVEEFLDELQRDEMIAERQMKKYTRYDEWRARKLENPEIRAALEELQPAFTVARLRILAGKFSERDADEAETFPDPEKA